MTAAVLRIELRLRARTIGSLASGLIMVAAITGALFPAFGDSLGNVDLPEGVGNLIGGGNFSSIAGWLNTEIVSVYGPLIVGGAGITAAAATLAGDEEAHVLAILLARPVARARLLLAKAAAVAVSVGVLGVAAFAGLLISVALAGGGLGAGHLAALALHLACLGLSLGSLALAIAGQTGRKATAAGGAAGIAVAMYLVNGLAPVVSGLHWLKYLTLFHYYQGQNPLESGVHPGGLAVMLAFSAAATGAAIAGFSRRDLRA